MIAPPTPYVSPEPSATIVRITIDRSIAPSREKYPTAPEYTPRGPCSSRSMISIVRIFGAPVMEPPGNAARTASTAVLPGASRQLTVLTS